jgi:hypothetical protein
MFVGYSVHHTNDIYRMLNLDIKSMIQSHEIILLNEHIMTGVKGKFCKRRILMIKMMMSLRI